MIPVLKKILAVLLCVSMVVCSSMHVVADGQSAVKQVGNLRTDGLASGDTLRIVGYDGSKQIMEFSRIDGGALLGKVDGKERSIALDQVNASSANKSMAPRPPAWWCWSPPWCWRWSPPWGDRWVTTWLTS